MKIHQYSMSMLHNSLGFTSALHLLLYGIIGVLQAQNAEEIAVGTWRTHLSYRNVISLTNAGDRIFAASSNGLFAYHFTTAQLETFSRANGLSDVAFSDIAWDAASASLVVVYRNGNIDLLTDDEVVNIRTILNASIQQKRLNQISIYKGKAYLAADFGIAELDLSRRRLGETYLNIGSNGTRAIVRATAIVRDSIFAATDQGILAASLATSVNRLDFRNWRLVPGTAQVEAIASVAGHIYFIQQNRIFNYQPEGRLVPVTAPGTNWNSLYFSQGSVLATAASGLVWQLAPGQAPVAISTPATAPQKALRDAQNRLWIADAEAGLIGQPAGNGFRSLVPSGPFSADVFRLVQLGNGQMLALAGGYDERYSALGNRNGFYVFERGQWTNYNSSGLAGVQPTPPISDLVDASTLQAGEIYLASFGGGLLRWIPADNSFSQLTGASLPFTGNRISALHRDSRGRLWAATHGSGLPSVYRQEESGNWTAVPLSGFNAANPLRIASDNAGNIWIILSPNTGGGLILTNGQGRSRNLGSARGQGNLPSALVTSLAYDHSGAMWVGTNSGIGIFFNAGAALESNVDAGRAIFESRELLRNERINAIAVDGGNRKWIATNNGVWLFSDNGSRLFHHFTARNSPLLSDIVLDVSIIPTTGEVFFATSEGIVSYRGTATTGGSTFEQVKVFPNPVPPGYSGLITISGLASNANVKITDTAGRLVYETTAAGGTAIWNGRDYKGVAVRSGVYAVYASDSEGVERFATRFALVE